LDKIDANFAEKLPNVYEDFFMDRPVEFNLERQHRRTSHLGLLRQHLHVFDDREDADD